VLNLFEKSVVWFNFGLKLKPRWVNGLVGIAITYFEMGYNSRAVSYIKSARQNFKGEKFVSSEDERCHFSEDEINFLQCTFLRKQGDFKKAADIYKGLQPILD
jgi:hypothetical protein